MAKINDLHDAAYLISNKVEGVSIGNPADNTTWKVTSSQEFTEEELKAFQELFSSFELDKIVI